MTNKCGLQDEIKIDEIGIPYQEYIDKEGKVLRVMRTKELENPDKYPPSQEMINAFEKAKKR